MLAVQSRAFVANTGPAKIYFQWATHDMYISKHSADEYYKAVGGPRSNTGTSQPRVQRCSVMSRPSRMADERTGVARDRGIAVGLDLRATYRRDLPALIARWQKSFSQLFNRSLVRSSLIYYTLARRLLFFLRCWCRLALGARGALTLRFRRALIARGSLMRGSRFGLRFWRLCVLGLCGLGWFGFSLGRTFFMRRSGFGFSFWRFRVFGYCGLRFTFRRLGFCLGRALMMGSNWFGFGVCRLCVFG